MSLFAILALIMATAGAALHPPHSQPPKPTVFYDSAQSDAVPSGNDAAFYANGAYTPRPEDVKGREHVLWIDVTGANPRAGAIDVEPGDATPHSAAMWVKAKLGLEPKSRPIIYTFSAGWQDCRNEVTDHLPKWMQDRVRWWIAHPTGHPHILPGADATQWGWYKTRDTNSARPGFWD